MAVTSLSRGCHIAVTSLSRGSSGCHVTPRCAPSPGVAARLTRRCGGGWQKEMRERMRQAKLQKEREEKQKKEKQRFERERNKKAMAEALIGFEHTGMPVCLGMA